jgi:hypothetical protein
MKPTLIILILLLSYHLSAQQDTSAILSKYPLLTWLRKSPVDISCMLESQLGYQDRRFRCGRKYVNKGDPCRNTKEYYKGLQIPEKLIPRIHPLFEDMTLFFEHGNLQMIVIEFKDSMTIGQIKSIFALPLTQTDFPPNVIYIDYGYDERTPGKTHDAKYSRELILTGFEHMGAGDVDCK